MTARKPLTIVIKLGTSSIVSTTYPFLPHLQLLSSIVETVVQLRELGHRVVLCSSGAIGVGLRRMGLKERGKGLSHKQALAAIGQGRLIALYDNLFSQLDQPIAQILLTRMDISDRTRYLNAQNTFSELLQMGVVPIVNENDTVSVSEIKFGDNDTLSAISSAIVHADYLFLLTDVECLYTDNPRNNPQAKPVRVVRDIQKVRQQVSVSTLGTSLGTGGMSTKLIAAELATAAGVTTVIMHSEKVRDIFGVIENGQAPSRESVNDGDLGELEQGPVCTRFLRREEAMKDRKWWIAHGLHSAGTVVIDEGAARAIKRKESGGRILPAGVIRVEGTFASHQAIRILVRHRKRRDTIRQIDTHGYGSNSNSIYEEDQSPTPSDSRSRGTSRDHLPSLRFQHHTHTPGGVSPNTLNPNPNTNTNTTVNGIISIGSSRPSPEFPGGGGGSSTTGSDTTTPETPFIQPILSLSSSIASLAPLSRSTPNSPAMQAISERTSIAAVLDRSGLRESILAEDVSFRGLGVGEGHGDGQGHDLEGGIEGGGDGDVGEGDEKWEEVEIGKGLAQYNSVEIDRLKGMKSSHIERVIGYCESEHVVDSITLWS